MKLGKPKCFNADFQARIEPPPIPMTRALIEKVKDVNIININMLRDPASATSETYEINPPTL